MSEMKVNNLGVDLLQDGATIALFKQNTGSPGKQNFTAVSVNVPLRSLGDQPEKQLRRAAIDQARIALKEAIAALDDFVVN